MSRRLIMLRHGQTAYNAGQRMQGQLDTQLSDIGVEQAHAAAEWVQGKDIITVISSDLTRASDTAAIVAAGLGLDVTHDARLRETHLGQWQGMTRDEVDEAFVGARAAWRHDPAWTPPGGESRLDVAMRARPVIDELMNDLDGWDGHAVLIVAHGGTITALTALLLGFEHSQYPLIKSLNNTNAAQLSARPRYRGEHTAMTFSRPIDPADVQWYLDAWNQGLNQGMDYGIDQGFDQGFDQGSTL